MADVVAFDEFYLATRADLLRQLTAMTGDPEMAQDVLQEAYARGWQRWSRVSGLEDPGRLGAHRGLAACRQPVPQAQGGRPVPGRAAATCRSTYPLRRTSGISTMRCAG